MTRLGKFLCLTSSDRHLLVFAAVLLGAIRAGLRVLPFRIVLRLLARATKPSAHRQKPDPPSEDRLIWAVTMASRYMPGTGTCLTQALAAQVMLACRGHPSRLHIGVSGTVRHRLEAHAWVESQGRAVVGGPDHRRFTPLVAFGRAGP